MMRQRPAAELLLAVTVAAVATVMRPAPAAALPAAAAPHYAFITQIHLAGDGGWDYLSIDAAARRLYVAHGDHVDVVDIDHNTLVGSIVDTPGVHDVAIAHQIGRAYISDGQTAQASIVDLNTLGAAKLKSQYLSWKWAQGETTDGKLVGFPIDIGPTALYYR